MAYNNYFPQTYQPYYPQMQPVVQQQTQMPTPQPQDNSGVIWVSGIEGAKSYLVGAGKSVLLLDSENSTFYLKSTDMSGMPQPLRIFDYTERTAQTHSNQIMDAQVREIDTSMFVTRDELEERLAKLSTPKTTKTTVAKGAQHE